MTGLGRADVHVAINLSAVGIYYLAIEIVSQAQSKLAFTYCCWADNSNKALHWVDLLLAVWLTMLTNSSALRLAPPTRAPSISVSTINSAMLLPVTLPPYSMRTALAVSLLQTLVRMLRIRLIVELACLPVAALPVPIAQLGSAES